MKFPLLNRSAALALLGLVFLASPSNAEGFKTFEKAAGDWRLTCFKEARAAEPYCRIMVLQVLADGGKTGNFIQFGPSFDRGNAGIVVATYLGFARASQISLAVDGKDVWNVPAPKINHVIATTEATVEALKSMNQGKQLTLSFTTVTGFQKSVKTSLEDFRILLGEAKDQLGAGMIAF